MRARRISVGGAFVDIPAVFVGHVFHFLHGLIDFILNIQKRYDIAVVVLPPTIGMVDRHREITSVRPIAGIRKHTFLFPADPAAAVNEKNNAVAVCFMRVDVHLLRCVQCKRFAVGQNRGIGFLFICLLFVGFVLLIRKRLHRSRAVTHVFINRDAFRQNVIVVGHILDVEIVSARRRRFVYYDIRHDSKHTVAPRYKPRGSVDIIIQIDVVVKLGVHVIFVGARNRFFGNLVSTESIILFIDDVILSLRGVEIIRTELRIVICHDKGIIVYEGHHRRAVNIRNFRHVEHTLFQILVFKRENGIEFAFGINTRIGITAFGIEHSTLVYDGARGKTRFARAESFERYIQPHNGHFILEAFLIHSFQSKFEYICQQSVVLRRSAVGIGNRLSVFADHAVEPQHVEIIV